MSVRVERGGAERRVVTVTLSDPARRNALGDEMFNDLFRELEAIERSIDPDAGAAILHLRGEGPSFCAGFDLAACVGQDGAIVLAEFIRRLSRLVRVLRRGPFVIVAEVRGAALAGGCAILAACDFVFVAPNSQLGYPVHRLGISPAVTIPLLAATIGAGEARALLLSGEIIDGDEAFRRGLASRVVPESLLEEASREHCQRLAQMGPRALLATRRWLNELEHSGDDFRFDAASTGSAELCLGDESRRMLGEFWERRRMSPPSA